MDLKQLNHLMAVADYGSFSSAARALHTVQSNVSNHVAKLEKELGIVLLDRKTMQPTPEGQTVIERARRIKNEVEAISGDLVNINEEIDGQIKLGCVGITSRWIINPLLTKLRETFPSVSPILIDTNNGSSIPKILGGNLDLAIVNAPIMNARLESELLFDEEKVLLAPLDHPLAKYKSLTTEELSDYEIMLTPQGTVFRDLLDEELIAAGVELKIAAEVDGLRLLASLAHEGFAPALLPASAASGYPDMNCSLIKINGLLKRPVSLIRNKRITPSLPARTTRDLIREIINDVGPTQPGIHVRLEG